MGQKVNPYGFRLGITTDWKSRWFEERHYREFVVEDWKIRDYLMKQLEAAAVSRIEASELKEVVITNSIPMSEAAKQCKRIKSLSIAQLMANAIRSIHEETSVSTLFV